MFFKRVHIDVGIVHWDTTAMDGLARQAANAQIYSALIAVSVMKTPNVFNIQTVSRFVIVNRASLGTVSARTAVLSLRLILVTLCVVRMGEHA